jgi:hypothetical protein
VTYSLDNQADKFVELFDVMNGEWDIQKVAFLPNSFARLSIALPKPKNATSAL